MGEPSLVPAAALMPEEAEQVVAPSTRRRRLRRVLRRPLSVVVGLAVLLLLVMAVFGPMLAPYDPINPDPLHEFLAPSASHLMGTDDLGRDVFSRILAGTRYSLLAGAVILSIAVVVGLVVGSTAGYAGGALDEVLMRATDIILAFPGIILALALAAALGAAVITGIAEPEATRARLARRTVRVPWSTSTIRVMATTPGPSCTETKPRSAASWM